MPNILNGLTLKLKREEMYNEICVGFVSNRGVMLDLDHTTLNSSKRLAEALCKRYRLEGYIIVRSSPKNYHIVFNRKNISWRKTMHIIFSIVKAISWSCHQAFHGNMTLRISCKNGCFPEVVYRKGKRDKLVKEYLETLRMLKTEIGE